MRCVKRELYFISYRYVNNNGVNKSKVGAVYEVYILSFLVKLKNYVENILNCTDCVSLQIMIFLK